MVKTYGSDKLIWSYCSRLRSNYLGLKQQTVSKGTRGIKGSKREIITELKDGRRALSLSSFVVSFNIRVRHRPLKGHFVAVPIVRFKQIRKQILPFTGLPRACVRHNSEKKIGFYESFILFTKSAIFNCDSVFFLCILVRLDFWCTIWIFLIILSSLSCVFVSLIPY
jgi:hypothetical protein